MWLRSRKPVVGSEKGNVVSLAAARAARAGGYRGGRDWIDRTYRMRDGSLRRRRWPVQTAKNPLQYA